MKHRNLALLALTPLALLATGCSTTDSAAAAPSQTARPETSLVAGDALGQVLFTGPTMTASAGSAPRPSFAEVPSR